MSLEVRILSYRINHQLKVALNDIFLILWTSATIAYRVVTHSITKINQSLICFLFIMMTLA